MAGIQITYPEADKYYADIAAGKGTPGEQEAAAPYDSSNDTPLNGPGQMITGGYLQSFQRPDGSIYTTSVNADGSPIKPEQPYTQSELDNGIRIGGDTRSPEQISADYASDLDRYNRDQGIWSNRQQQPTTQQPTAGQQPTDGQLAYEPGGGLPTPDQVGAGQLQVVPQYTNPEGWGAANVTNDSFVWVNPATGTGDTFNITRNADGTLKITRSDGLVVERADRTLFEQYFPRTLADRYFGPAGGGGGTAPQMPGGGMIPGGGGSAVTNPDGTVSDPGTVGSGNWSVQPGHSFRLPDGTGFSVTSVNPDGTITWRRTDGSVFANVSRDVFESLLGKDMADQWYGRMSPGSTGGVARVEGMRDAMPEGNALPERFQPAQMQPYTREIDFGKETVQGQLQGMLASGSPLLQRAEASAAAAANQRGLINSTMAVQSGRAAVYDVALKIAEMDANIYNAKSRDNMQALNAAEAANVSAANQFIGTQLAAELQITQTNAQLQADIAKINAEGAIRLDIADAESRAKIEQILIDANARKVMQANASAGTLLQNTIGAINTIMLNKDGFDAAAKDAMIGRQITMFKTGIALIEEMGGDVSLSGYLDQLNMALGIGDDGVALSRPPQVGDATYNPQIYQPGGANTSTNLTNYDLTGRFNDN